MSDEFPVLATKQLVIFPGTRCWAGLGNERALLTVAAALRSEKTLLAFFTSRVTTTSEAPMEQLHSVGTVARVMDLVRRSCCGRWLIEVEGVSRVRFESWLRIDPFREARCCHLPDSAQGPSLHGVAEAIRAIARRFYDIAPDCKHARHAIERLAACDAPARLTGAVAELLAPLPVERRQCLLETDQLAARLEATLVALNDRLLQMESARWQVLQ
jgi:ATP-dependent Lon protease